MYRISRVSTNVKRWQLFYCRYDDDDSQLSQKCAKWGNYKDGKWGGGRESRLADYTMYVQAKNHWVLRPSQDRYDCDYYRQPFSTEDFWNVYVR